jgi:TM2 domain-containing membrane protein YozV
MAEMPDGAYFCKYCGGEREIPGDGIASGEEKKFCSSCGERLRIEATYCPVCGKQQSPTDRTSIPFTRTTAPGGPGPTPSIGMHKQEVYVPISQKNPLHAAILSLFFPGVGQVYNGQILKGVIFLVVDLFLEIINDIIYELYFLEDGPLSLLILVSIPFIGFYIIAAVDAYITAGKINRGELVNGI